MEVRVYATLRPIVGSAVVAVETAPGESFRKLLNEMAERWPRLRGELFDADGELQNRIHVFLNGRDIRYLGGLDMPIPEGAHIRVFPPVGGGEERQPLVHDYYGVPLWLMKDYLASLGGVETAEDVLEGAGWQAALSKAVPNKVGSLVIGGTTARFTGDEAALAALFERLHWKTQRGGG